MSDHDSLPLDLAYTARLKDRSFREATGRYFVEGVRFVVAAHDANARIAALVVAPKLLRSAPGEMVARRLGASGVPLLRVTPEEFRRVAHASEPQGIGAIVEQSRGSLQEPRPDDCWVLLESVRAEGNVGTILRTSEAVGGAGLIVPRWGSLDPYDPATVRASMGAILSRAIFRPTRGELEAWRRGRVLFVGAAADARRDYREVCYRRPVVLVLGHERSGLSPAQQKLCDVTVRIPMTGRTDSLNLGVAASLLLYEAFNQRNPCATRFAWREPGARGRRVARAPRWPDGRTGR